jgi:hypothetical protein
VQLPDQSLKHDRKPCTVTPGRICVVLLRWRDETTKAVGRIKRMVLAFEAVRDGFWLARWLLVAMARKVLGEFWEISGNSLGHQVLHNCAHYAMGG